MVFKNLTKKIFCKYFIPLLLITSLSLVMSGLLIYVLNSSSLSGVVSAVSLLSKNKIKQKVALENEQFLWGLNEQLNEEIGRIENGLYYLSLIEGNTKTFKELSKQLMDSEPYLEGLFIAEKEGLPIFQVLKNDSLNTLFQQMPFDYQLLDTARLGFTTGILMDNNTPYLIYAQALKSNPNKVVAGIINGQLLRDEVEAYTKNKPFHIVVANGKGEAVYNTVSCSFFEKDTILNSFDIASITKEKAGSNFENGLTVFNQNKRNWTNIYHFDSDAYERALAADSSILMKLFNGMQSANLTSLVVLLTIIILLSSIAAYLVARSITKPIVDLTEATRELSKGNFTVQVEKRTNDEVGELTDSFNGMINTLKSSRESLQEKRLQIEVQAKELAASNADLENYAMMASHDLKEPIRMITSYIQLLDRKYAGQFDDEARSYVDFALDGSKRMRQMVEDLLEYARYNKKNNPPKISVDLNTVLNQVQKNLQQKIGATAADIQVEQLPIIASIPSHMLSLFQNLVENAIKYVDPSRTPQVAIFAKQEDGFYFITVKDNGIGIPEDRFDDVFAIFKRLHGRTEYDGTGIGMAICQKILAINQGELLLESKVGVGSEFTVKLPV